MNRQGRVAALAAAALVVCLGSAACDKKDWPIQGEGAPGIDAVALNQQLLQYLTDNQIAGATVAVTRAGRLVWSTAYGWADEDDDVRMKPWHRSRIGSTSKFLTAIGLLQQLESAAGDGNLDSLATGSDLQTLLSTKLYGHPGNNWENPSELGLTNPGGGAPDWPNVTGQTALANPELYWEALQAGVENFTPGQGQPGINMDQIIEWASSIDIRNLLTHTSGHLRSGDADAAAVHFDDVVADGAYPTYSQLHQYMLMGLTWADESSHDVNCYLDGALYVHEDDTVDYTGQDYHMPPLRYEPGTKRCYSNHGFGVTGMLIDEIAGTGEENTYRRVVEREILEPLGLFGVAPNDVETGDLDAFPHGSSFGTADPSGNGLATGGWSATAQDLARIMCGIDRVSNNLRLLDPATVAVMETVAFPDVDPSQPLGWDDRNGLRLTKNGAIGGGASQIAKYLPGKFASAPEDEINVAVMFNDTVGSPGTGLLDDIASKIADADIPDDYDLFDLAYRCFVPEPEPEEPGLVAPVPTVTEPLPPPPLVNPTVTPNRTTNPQPTLVAPTGTRTPRTPPTVTILLPYNGWQPAPRGVATIPFHGSAVDAASTAIPGTRLRWTAIEGSKSTVLCVGSAFSPAPGTPGGVVNPADCTTFSRQFTNPVAGSGPNITIRVEARDQNGLVGSAEVIIALYTPPVR